MNKWRTDPFSTQKGDEQNTGGVRVRKRKHRQDTGCAFTVQKGAEGFSGKTSRQNDARDGGCIYPTPPPRITPLLFTAQLNTRRHHCLLNTPRRRRYRFSEHVGACRFAGGRCQHTHTHLSHVGLRAAGVGTHTRTSLHGHGRRNAGLEVRFASTLSPTSIWCVNASHLEKKNKLDRAHKREAQAHHNRIDKLPVSKLKLQ